MGPLRFDAIEPGLVFDTPGITVTEGHILGFAGLTGDFFDIHMDEDFARGLGYPGRVAHGLLGLALCDGLKNRAETRFAAVVSLGWRWTFTGPILVGDRIGAQVRVLGKRATKRADRGIVTLGFALRNQRGETVQQGENDLMVMR
jgi:acyl dehydratase